MDDSRERLASEFRAAVAALKSSGNAAQTDIWNKPPPLPSEFPINLCSYCRSLKLTVSSFALPPGQLHNEEHCYEPAILIRNFADIAESAKR